MYLKRIRARNFRAFGDGTTAPELNWGLNPGLNILVGENDAGKSTLMKVLTGIYTKDSGTITYEGKEVEFHSAREAQDNGVIIVHQELNMLGHLTVAQNLFIGREFKKGITIDDKKMNEEAKKLFDRLNVDIDPILRRTVHHVVVVRFRQVIAVLSIRLHTARLLEDFPPFGLFFLERGV